MRKQQHPQPAFGCTRIMSHWLPLVSSASLQANEQQAHLPAGWAVAGAALHATLQVFGDMDEAGAFVLPPNITPLSSKLAPMLETGYGTRRFPPQSLASYPTQGCATNRMCCSLHLNLSWTSTQHTCQC